MRKRDNTVNYTVEDVKSLKDESDWARVRSMAQSEVERLADEEDGPLPEGWQNTIVLGVPEPKQDVHIRLDAYVLRWFKAQGPGYQTRINEVLRGFVASRQQTGLPR